MNPLPLKAVILKSENSDITSADAGNVSAGKTASLPSLDIIDSGKIRLGGGYRLPIT